MKVILREDIDHVGKMGELVTVADGYARNFLLPRQMVAAATEKNIRALEHQKRLIEAKRKKERAAGSSASRGFPSRSRCRSGRKTSSSAP
jgi:large subunit ribosomal protein L9